MKIRCGVFFTFYFISVFIIFILICGTKEVSLKNEFPFGVVLDPIDLHCVDKNCMFWMFHRSKSHWGWV